MCSEPLALQTAPAPCTVQSCGKPFPASGSKTLTSPAPRGFEMKVHLLLHFSLVFASRGEAEGARDQDYQLPRCSVWRASPVCLSQQLLTLGPTLVTRKCFSTLRVVLSLSRCGIPCVGAHSVLTVNLPAGRAHHTPAVLPPPLLLLLAFRPSV